MPSIFIVITIDSSWLLFIKETQAFLSLAIDWKPISDDWLLTQQLLARTPPRNYVPFVKSYDL